MPKRDMVVRGGDTLTLGNQTLTFHQLPAHTPGVLMTEGMTVLERAALLKTRKPGSPHPFVVDPATWNQRAKAAQESAVSTLAAERAKTSGGK